MSTVYEEIAAERARAHAKHGDNSMESHSPQDYHRLAILTEEVGEVAREFNEAEIRGTDIDLMALRTELIQVAAMAAAWADVIETTPGCDCTELCSMGPTCPGGYFAGLPGAGCFRSRTPEPVAAVAPDPEDEDLEQTLVAYDEQGTLFGSSGAGAYFLATHLLASDWLNAVRADSRAEGIELAAGMAVLYDTGEQTAAALKVAARLVRQVADQ